MFEDLSLIINDCIMTSLLLLKIINKLTNKSSYDFIGNFTV